MTDDIIRKATTADYIETIDNLRAEVERLRSTLVNLKAHNYVNAFPDGGYAMRILQSYREMCDQYVSDDITGGPTNPVYIAMNEANEKRKIELDKAISDLAGIAAKDARIKELEGMIKQLGSLAFMADYTPLDQIIAHFMSWGQSNYEYTSRLEVAFLRSNAAMRYYQEGNRGPWPQLGEKFKEPYQEKAREALERIKAETGSGDHVAGANKLILTAEQREEEGKRDA